eukprot:TRINITY_DN65988_c0_g1_i1.p1 TRINITY_DN65988_c0_g1~~TRINITY_DN65988_c0_g1_i1.p1  ORF type:complete len:332 (-),score=66.89 TRINITY_DN65988_c0_g1_i1:225-1220(-)
MTDWQFENVCGGMAAAEAGAEVQLVFSFSGTEEDSVAQTFTCRTRRDVLEDTKTRLGHSTVGAKWRSFGSTNEDMLAIEWQCQEEVGKAVACWLTSQQDLALPRSPPNGAMQFLEDVLTMWEFATGEKWQKSQKWLSIDFRDHEGARLWFTRERRVSETLSWFRYDILRIIHAIADDSDRHYNEITTCHFRPLRGLDDMATATTHHFVLCNEKVTWDHKEPIRILHERFKDQMMSVYYTDLFRYTAVFACPKRGKRSKEEVVEALAGYGLEATWWFVEVEMDTDTYWTWAPLPVLSITFAGAEPAMQPHAEEDCKEEEEKGARKRRPRSER